jgi:hypothetical protein
MNASRSFYLNSRQDDFAELQGSLGQAGPVDIPYVTPANDDVPARVRLSARGWDLLRRLIATGLRAL